MQLPIWGGRTLASSDILVRGTIHGFSLEAIAKRNGICWRFLGEDKETEIGSWYGWLPESWNEKYILIQSKAIIYQGSINTHPSQENLISD